MSSRTRSRRWAGAVVLAALVACLLVVLHARDARTPARADVSTYRSRPDLVPPPLRVTGSTGDYVFLAPKSKKGQSGPMIVDGHGRLVWFQPLPKGTLANDFKAQTYQGRPVLAWWEGRTNSRGYGKGEWVIADASYREIARVRARRGLRGDLHDMQLTDRGTALITIYNPVRADLSVAGARPDAHQAVDSVIQEIDVASGDVVFEWHSLDHVALSESHAGPPTEHLFPYDYFHINSIDVDTDGNLLVSARNTWTIYKVNRRTGKVMWRLGGKRSDFELSAGVRFAWQHDARRQADGTITLFDNESAPKAGDHSRLLTLRVDEAGRRVTVARALTHPAGVLADAEGNSQSLADGHVFAGWGLGRRASEQDAGGKLLFDARLPGDYDSYRAFRFHWSGEPADPPALAATRDGDRVTAYASWNGATGVARWQLLASGKVVAEAPAAGFETVLSAGTEARAVAVRALDVAGHTLGTSPAR